LLLRRQRHRRLIDNDKVVLRQKFLLSQMLCVGAVPRVLGLMA
jgi:hypothetical protein